jgi:hypothetical protein
MEQFLVLGIDPGTLNNGIAYGPNTETPQFFTITRPVEDEFEKFRRDIHRDTSFAQLDLVIRQYRGEDIFAFIEINDATRRKHPSFKNHPSHYVARHWFQLLQELRQGGIQVHFVPAQFWQKTLRSQYPRGKRPGCKNSQLSQYFCRDNVGICASKINQDTADAICIRAYGLHELQALAAA